MQGAPLLPSQPRSNRCVRISAAGLPANFLFEILKRYLQVQGIMLPLAGVMVTGALVNVRAQSVWQPTVVV
jgi:Na+-driven multidrug efflux pump